MLPPAASALTPTLTRTTVRSPPEPSLVSRPTVELLPPESVTEIAPVVEDVEDNSRLTTRVWPATTPGELTETVVVVLLVEAVADPTRRTKPAAAAACGVGEASLGAAWVPP